MERDLETFLTALSVIVDDFYQRHIVPQLPACGGPAAQRSESEVRCVGLAVHWRSGVPGKSARGIMRYGCKPLRHLFPTVLTPSACNRRLRRLWGVCMLLQEAVAEPLGDAGPSEVMDGCPIPPRPRRPVVPARLVSRHRADQHRRQ